MWQTTWRLISFKLQSAKENHGVSGGGTASETEMISDLVTFPVAVIAYPTKYLKGERAYFAS